MSAFPPTTTESTNACRPAGRPAATDTAARSNASALGKQPARDGAAHPRRCHSLDSMRIGILCVRPRPVIVVADTLIPAVRQLLYGVARAPVRERYKTGRGLGRTCGQPQAGDGDAARHQRSADDSLQVVGD